MVSYNEGKVVVLIMLNDKASKVIKLYFRDRSSSPGFTIFQLLSVSNGLNRYIVKNIPSPDG